MGALRASVIVPVRDAEGAVGGLLDALAAQTLAPDAFEVLCVDDASTDATARCVEAHPRSELVRAPRQGGSYAARNLGLAAARGAVLAFTDADCRPTADWLQRGLAAVDATGADLVGGDILVPLSERPTLAELLDAARGIDQRRQVLEWGFAATANLFVRREVVERIGPFNERLISGGDDEFCKRGTAAGFRLAFAPEARVVHPPRRRARQVVRKAFRVGFGAGQLRHVGTGPAAGRPPLWRRPSAWRPRRGVLGVERLAAAGAAPTGLRTALLDAAQFVLVQVPMAVGDLVASLRRGRA